MPFEETGKLSFALYNVHLPSVAKMEKLLAGVRREVRLALKVGWLRVRKRARDPSPACQASKLGLGSPERHKQHPDLVRAATKCQNLYSKAQRAPTNPTSQLLVEELIWNSRSLSRNEEEESYTL